MRKRRARLAVLVTCAALALAAFPVLAQEAGIAILDPTAAPGEAPGSVINFAYREDGPDRALTFDARRDDANTTELQIAADGQAAGVPLDFSISHRVSLAADSAGDLTRRGHGAEVRVGQGLTQRNNGAPRWYVFAASDDEALTWQPGSRNDFGGRGASLARQDRVEIGDAQAGVTFEQNGVQASLAYVERQVSSTVGVQTVSHDENFAGVTVTMRR